MFLLQIPLIVIHWWCPVLIWWLSLGFSLAIGLAVRDGILRLKRLHQIPCNRCAFYTREYRLKCTVNPYQAFTEEAIDCRDWEPKTLSIGCRQRNLADLPISWGKMFASVTPPPSRGQALGASIAPLRLEKKALR